MRTQISTMVKKVTATILAAATVMAATVAATPAIVRAEEFKGIKLEELSDHPTAGMDINIIKNAYRVGGNLGTNIPSGTVAYIKSGATTSLDMGTPHGSDIVVVYRTYTVTNLFGGKVSKVNCKSLIDGETFDLTIDNNCMSAQLYELNRAQNLNDAGIDVDDAGLQTSFQQVKGWFSSIKDFLF